MAKVRIPLQARHTVASFLRQVRAARALVQEEVAERAGVTRQTVINWEGEISLARSRKGFLRLVLGYGLLRAEADYLLSLVELSPLRDEEVTEYIRPPEGAVEVPILPVPTYIRLQRRVHDDRLMEEALKEKFSGRRSELQWLDSFVENHPKGYALVYAPPGAGKTSLLARWIQQRKHSIWLCYHFFSKEWGTDRVSVFLPCMVEQLCSLLSIDYELGGRNEGDASEILWECLEKSHPGEKLVIVLDAIDEASSEYRVGFALPRGLFPPKDRLTDGTFLIFSSRELTENTPLYYERQLGTQFEDCLSIPDLAEEDIAFLLSSFKGQVEEEVAIRLEGLSKDREFLSLIRDKTGGLALWVSSLVSEVAQKISQGEDPWTLVEGLPSQFEDYVERLARGVAEKGWEKWDKVLCFLASAEEALYQKDLCALVNGLEERDFKQMPWEVLRLVKARKDGNTSHYTFSHPSYKRGFQYYMGTDAQKYRRLLASFCLKWAENMSPYALRYAPEHLRENDMVPELWGLATNEAFLRAQQTQLSEVTAPLNTLRHALGAACDCDDVAAMAKFLLRHARLQTQTAGVQSLLSILKKSGVQEAWRLCELRHGRERVLSYLLLAWHLARKGDWQSYDDTLRRVAESGVSPAPESGLDEIEWQEEARQFLVTQICDVDEERGKKIAAQLLTDTEKEELIKLLALRGQFAQAQAWMQALFGREIYSVGRSIENELNRQNFVDLIEEAEASSDDEGFKIFLDQLEGIAERGIETEHPDYPDFVWSETLELIAESLERYGRQGVASDIRKYLQRRGVPQVTQIMHTPVDKERQLQEEKEVLRQARVLKNLAKSGEQLTYELIKDALRSSEGADDRLIFKWILGWRGVDAGKVAVRMARKGDWAGAIEILEATMVFDDALFRRTCADLAEVATKWKGQICVESEGATSIYQREDFARQLLEAGLDSASSEPELRDADKFTLVDLAKGFVSLGEMDRAEEALDAVPRLGRDLDIYGLAVAATARIGLKLLHVGRREEAADVLREALSLWKKKKERWLPYKLRFEVGEPFMLAVSLGDIVAGLAEAGYTDEAIAEAKAAWIHSGRCLLAIVKVLVAQDRLEKAIEIASEMPGVGNEARDALAAIGVAYARKGNLERGLSVVRHWMCMTHTNYYEDYDPYPKYPDIEYWLLRERGQEDEARALLEVGTAEVSARLYIEAAAASSEHTEQVGMWLDSALKNALLIPEPEKRSSMLTAIGQLFARGGDIEKALSIATSEKVWEEHRARLLVSLAEEAGKADKVGIVCGLGGKLTEEKRLLDAEIDRQYSYPLDDSDPYGEKQDEAVRPLEKKRQLLQKQIACLALGMAQGGVVEEALQLTEEIGEAEQREQVFREIGRSLVRAGRIQYGYSLAVSLRAREEKYEDDKGEIWDFTDFSPLKDRAWLLLGMGEELAGTARAEAANALGKAFIAVRDLVEHEVDKGDAVKELLLGPKGALAEAESGLLSALARASDAVGERAAALKVLQELWQYVSSPDAQKSYQTREEQVCLREVAYCLLSLGEKEHALELALQIDSPQERDVCLESVSTAFALRGDMAKAVSLVNLVSDTQRPMLVSDLLAGIAVEQGRKGDLKLLLPFAAQYVGLAYTFCPLLVEFYRPESEVIQGIVEEIVKFAGPNA